MSGIRSVAFGPSDSFIVCRDSGITWSGGLPTPIYNKLNGRRNNHACAPTNVAAMGHGGDYVLFFDNHKWWVNCGGLSDTLNENGIDGEDVKTFSFGDDGSYILMLKNGHLFWRGVNERLSQLIETRNQYGIEWVTIGKDDTYFIRYDDGQMYWCGQNIGDILKNDCEDVVEKVWLSPFDDNYFIAYTNGRTSWRSCQNFSNNQHCDKWMSPRNIYYTNSSISQEFTCGRCIHETARELEEGTLSADDIPCMHVVEYQGCTYSLNNRRLWALSRADVDDTPVKIVQMPGHIEKKLRNGFDGRSVRLR